MTRPAPKDGIGVARRWRPVPAVRISVLVHAAGAAALVAEPALWWWSLGVLAANHLVLSAAVLWPRGRLLGPNLIGLPVQAAARNEVCLTFDDGPDTEVTPRVLDLLDAYQAKASFFCVGERAAANPHLVKEIVRRGHSVENHSYRHSRAFSFYGLSRLRRDVEAAQEVLTRVTGRPPKFFRAPAGFRSVLLDPVLARYGLCYVSWTRRSYDTVSRDPGRILSRLTDGLGAGDILVLHDGALEKTGQSFALATLAQLLRELSRRGLRSVALPEAFRDG